MLMMEEANQVRSDYEVNWLAVGNEAVKASSAFSTEYWGNVPRTGFLGVARASQPDEDGFNWLANGYASLQLVPEASDVVNTSRALIPYKDSVHEVLINTKLNAVMAFLGDSFPSGVAPGIVQASMDAGAVTIAVVSQPREDEGRKHFTHAKYAFNEIKPSADAMCVLPLDMLCRYLSSSVVISMIEKAIYTVFANAVRGILDLSEYGGFGSPNKEEIIQFFKLADNVLFGYAKLDGDAKHNAEAIRTALKNPFDRVRKFDEAEQILVSVCMGTQNIDMDFYLEIGRICKSVLGSSADVIVGSFESKLAIEDPWVAIYGRGLKDRRNDGFDYPDARIDPEKAAPKLPAYYRQHFKQTTGRFH
ncbi:hypothetical protein JW979_15970 [bacterium]|nr:hypothetical protein [candidate division CSSED10-310 bacterium]